MIGTVFVSLDLAYPLHMLTAIRSSRTLQLSLIGVASLIGVLSMLLALFSMINETIHYPNSEEVTSFGRCDSQEWYRYERTFRLSYYGCRRTSDAEANVDVWYIRQGYRSQNAGWVVQSRGGMIIETTVVERVYVLEDEEGTMIRVYRDSTWRLPRLSSYLSR